MVFLIFRKEPFSHVTEEDTFPHADLLELPDSLRIILSLYAPVCRQPNGRMIYHNHLDLIFLRDPVYFS